MLILSPKSIHIYRNCMGLVVALGARLAAVAFLKELAAEEDGGLPLGYSILSPFFLGIVCHVSWLP